MKKFLKIFLAALALAAAVSLFVISIGASEAKPEMASYTNSQGETVESDFLSAIKEAKPGTTVTLLGNCNQITSAAIDKDLTVDLGGYSLSTTKSVTLFNVKESVTFTLTGTGSINITGMLYETNSSKSPTVNVVGSSGKGIKITQNNTSSTPYIVHNYNGTYLFKNLDVVTNFSAATSRYQSFFHNDTATTSATVTFDTVEFNAPNAKPNNPGTFILGVCGSNSKLYIKNSGLYCNASGLYLGHLVAPDNVTADGVGIETVIAEITDSVISNGGKAHNAKSYGIFLEKEGFENSGAVGIVNVKNSLVESAGRAVYASVAGNGGQLQNVSAIVNFINSTLSGKTFTGSNGDYVLARHTIVNLDGSSKINSFKSDVNFAKDYGYVMGAVGTRSSSVETTNKQSGIQYPDGTYGANDNYAWIFDPAGDPEYPYVMVEKSSVSDNEPIQTTSVTFEGYYFQTSSELSGDTENLISRSDIDTKSKTNFGLNKVQAATRSGSLYAANNGTNTYFRYVATAHGPANVTVSGDKVSYSNKDSVASDSFYIMGGANSYNGNFAYFEDGNATVTVNDTDATFIHSRAKVVALSFDFGTDSDKGYTLVDFKLTSRYIASKTSTSSAQEVALFRINNDGSVKTHDAFISAVDAVELKPVGEWNNFSAVIYTDPALNDGMGQAYYYLNGELIGTSAVNSAYRDHLFIQGIRINICNGTSYKHTIGSSFCLDNFNYAVYSDYAIEGECDATEGALGTYKPESYKTSAPVYTYMGNSAVSVSGVPYASIEDALDKAEALGTNVELTRDFVGSVTANGSIDTNGYSLTLTPDSYGYDTNGDKLTFNKDYKYDVYWYIGELGNAEAMEDLSNYKKVEVKLGSVVDYGFVVDEKQDLASASVVKQVGWGKLGATVSETPFVPTLADYELYAGNANAKFYPVIDSAYPLNFYVKDKTGEIIAGGMDFSEATAAFSALADGDTFIMQSDITLDDTYIAKFITNATINIDLGGHALVSSGTGTFMFAGSGAVINLYSSSEGGSLVVNDKTAFIISDTTDISSRSAAYLAGRIDYVKNAKINVGTVTVGDNTYSGNNMSVVAKTLFRGYLGSDSCSFTMDGADLITTAGSYSIELYVYNGEANFKNGIIFAPNANNIVHAAGFSADSKYSGARNEGFENILITGLIRLENTYIVNMLAGLADGKNNNVVGNNGDSTNLFPDNRNDKRLIFKNVVTTGRLNPANEGARSLFEGFVAAEVYDVNGISNRVPQGYVTATSGIPMTWDMLDVGINGKIAEFKIPVVSGGEITSYLTYYIAENGADVSGLENVYTLPNYNFATGTKDDFVSVIFKDIDKETSLLEQYFVYGAAYTAPETLPTPSATISTEVLKLVWDGNAWTGLPSAGTKMTQSFTLVPGSTAAHNISELETNFSIYSDIGVSLYIPMKYKEYVSVAVGESMLDAVDYDTDGDAIADAVRFTVRKHVLDVATGVNFVITVTENGNTASTSVEIDIAYYTSKILENEEGDMKDKLLAYYLVNYAVEAVRYFTDGTPDASLTAILNDYAEIKTLPDATLEGAIADTGLGSVFTKATVSLTYTPNYVFRIVDGFEGEITFKFGSDTRSYTVEKGDNRMLVVENVAAYNLTDDVSVTAVGTVDEEAVEILGSYNLDTYFAYHVANAEDTSSETKDSSLEALDLIKALYDYATAAKAYIGE